MKKVNIVDVIDYLNNDCNGEFYNVSKEDFKDGNGVYGVFFGSRGEIEMIYKVENFKLRSKEELVSLWMGDENSEELREYGEEFIDSYEIDYNDLGGFVELLNEEESIEYYNVVV